MFVFHCEQQVVGTLFLHDHLIATDPHALHLLCSPTTHKNSCLVRVGTNCVTKPAVPRLLSEIQCSLCACSIGNEPQNMLVKFNALRTCMVCRLSNSVSSFVSAKYFLIKLGLHAKVNEACGSEARRTYGTFEHCLAFAGAANRP